MTTQRTYEQRHQAGLEVLDTMQGGHGDPERAARSMVRRHGALGSYAVDHVLGDLWSRTPLSRRDRSLVVVALLAAMGSRDELAAHVEFGLNHGLSRQEIDEIVLQVAAYAGYPMAMAAARVVDTVFCRLDGVDRQPPRQAPAPKDDAQRRGDAVGVLSTLTGGRTAQEPDQALADIMGRLGDVGRLAFDWAFGEVWANDRLSRRDRSLMVVAVLTWLGKENELGFHIRGALNHGATREELTEVMVQMTVYGGFPRAVDGMRVLRATLEGVDGA